MNKATTVAAAVLAMLGLSATTARAIDINGGYSWGGWAHRGNSLDVGLWGAGSTTRSYELYTSVFVSDGNMTSSDGTQIRNDRAPNGFQPGTFSPGSFANGHTILGIGLDMIAPASAVGTSFITFGLGNSSFQAASGLGATDGRVIGSQWANQGDFSIWMDGANGVNPNGPSQISAYMANGTQKGGSGLQSNLPGGIGSGVSYDYAFRLFRDGDTGGAVQYFFDLTAMQELYGVNQPENIKEKWNPAGGQIGTIGDNFKIVLYNSDAGHFNANQTVFGNIPPPTSIVPDGGGTLALLGGVLTGLAALLRRPRA